MCVLLAICSLGRLCVSIFLKAKITYKTQNKIENDTIAFGKNRPRNIYLDHPCSTEKKTSFFVTFAEDKGETVEEFERLTSTLQLYVVSF